jgi:hypothetical protein
VANDPCRRLQALAAGGRQRRLGAAVVVHRRGPANVLGGEQQRADHPRRVRDLPGEPTKADRVDLLEGLVLLAGIKRGERDGEHIGRGGDGHASKLGRPLRPTAPRWRGKGPRQEWTIRPAPYRGDMALTPTSGGEGEISTQADALPAIWVVRAGRGAHLADAFEARRLVALACPPSLDVSGAEIATIVDAICSAPRTNRARARSIASMLHRFVVEPQIGDLVLTPTPHTERLLLGEIAGGYCFRSDLVEAPHTREVIWHARLPRERITSEQMRTMGAPMAFQRPGRQDLLRSLFNDSVTRGSYSR